jgi:hypothetical protein
MQTGELSRAAEGIAAVLQAKHKASKLQKQACNSASHCGKVKVQYCVVVYLFIL